MANAMAHAIGVQASQPGRQVVSMSGDGGFAMLMGDLITLTQMKLPVKIVIFNNGVLGFVALEMKASGFVETVDDLQNPDFAAMARAMGIHAVPVGDQGDLPNAIRNVLAHGRPGGARRGDGSPVHHDHGGAGQGVQPVGAPRRDERSRRRGSRSGENQSVVALIFCAAVMSSF